MEREIILDHKRYPYTLPLKRMKTIRIKVESGKLIVSAPLRTPIRFIEELLYQHEASLVKQLEAYQAPCDLCDGGYVMIFGQHCTIKVMDVARKQCVRHDDVLYVYTQNVEAAVTAYLKQLLYDLIYERVSWYLKHDFHREMCGIVIRKYKGRWGSCYYQQNKISFNSALVHLPYELIDYVIVHELCHFLVHDHSKAFWYQVSLRIPQYRERRKRLKGVKI